MRNGDRAHQERDRDAQREGRRQQSGGEHPVPDHASGGRGHGGGSGPQHRGLSWELYVSCDVKMESFNTESHFSLNTFTYRKP